MELEPVLLVRSLPKTSQRIPLILSLPINFWIGFAIVGVTVPLNFLLEIPRTHILFFPIWTGISLVVDGVTYRRKGSSLLVRSWKGFISLFVISIIAWWIFEYLNRYSQNWHYHPGDFLSPLEYTLFASLNFSTVIPALFGMAELASTFKWIARLNPSLYIRPTPTITLIFFVSGWAMLGLLLAWPRICYPFLWLSIYFIVEPINIHMRYRNLAEHTATGDWRPIVSLWIGSLMTGILWESINAGSLPYWTYSTPGVEFGHIFRMPILGYGGYLPFSLEIFALYHLMIGLLRWPFQRYVQIAVPDSSPPTPRARHL